MNILLTGASGYIGENLLKLDSLHNFKQVEHNKKLTNCNNIYITDNIDSNTCWDGAFEGIDIVVHLAGVAHKKELTQQDFNTVNCLGTINLAENAAKAQVKRFIFISSILVHGPENLVGPVNEGDKLQPIGLYAQSKYQAEMGLLDVCAKSGMELVIIRTPMVYGAEAPGNFNKLVLMVKSMPILPFGLCNNRRSLISVGNLVDFITVCIDHSKAKNEIFCISDGQDVSIKMFTNAISKGLFKQTSQMPIPMFMIRALARLLRRSEQVEQLVGGIQINMSKAKSLLAWSPPETMVKAMSKLK